MILQRTTKLPAKKNLVFTNNDLSAFGTQNHSLRHNLHFVFCDLISKVILYSLLRNLPKPL